MENIPFCSIVIPAFNEEAFIEKCLSSLDVQSYPRERYEIIVVDNGSTDNTFKIAERYCDFVLKKEKGHVGSVRNYGVMKARGDILICTDSDCVVSKDWLTKGVELLKKNRKHAFGGGLILSPNATWIEKYWLLNESQQTVQQKDLMGSCIFCWKKDFISVGGFNEEITSGEDTELSQKLKNIGLKIMLVPELSVVHLGNAKTVKSFFLRQLWHSENYASNIGKSLNDPTFILVAINTLFLLFSIPLLVFNLRLVPFILSIPIVIPVVFSSKRIYRSRAKKVNWASLPLIYVIDLIYLNARSTGLLKGIASQLIRRLTARRL